MKKKNQTKEEKTKQINKIEKIIWKQNLKEKKEKKNKKKHWRKKKLKIKIEKKMKKIILIKKYLTHSVFGLQTE